LSNVQANDHGSSRRQPRIFPSHLATSGRLEIIAALERAGIKPIVLHPDVTAHGAVETYEDAKKCAALFKAHAAEIDGLIITLPNFGEERGLADAIRLADCACRCSSRHARRAGQDVHRFPRDSFCGKMSICNNLSSMEFLLADDAAHRGADSPEFKLTWLVRAVSAWCAVEERPPRRDRRAAHRIQHRTLLRKAPGALRHHRRDARPLRSDGPHRAHADNDDAAQAKLAAIRKYIPVGSTPKPR